MKQQTTSISKGTLLLNHVKTFLSKPQNVILLLLGIILTVSTVAPIIAIVHDTIKIHPGTIDAYITKKSSGYSLVNYTDLFTSRLATQNLWIPLLNTIILAIGSCVVSILFGGIFAFLVTRTNLAWKKYLSSIFIFPYIMPQWTLAVVWQHVFSSNVITGTSDGLLASMGILMPRWWCIGRPQWLAGIPRPCQVGSSPCPRHSWGLWDEGRAPPAQPSSSPLKPGGSVEWLQLRLCN